MLGLQLQERSNASRGSPQDWHETTVPPQSSYQQVPTLLQPYSNPTLLLLQPNPTLSESYPTPLYPTLP